MTQNGKWQVEGYDTFEGGPDAYYPVGDLHDSEAAAKEAAKNYLAELEKTQPSESSGGQSSDGIQDQIYITDPNGRRTRFFG